MGFYFLSSVLLMRSSLPREFRNGISEAAGDLEFDFYHHFFDALFLTSATATFTALLVQRASRRSARDRTLSAQGSVSRLAGERRHHYAVRASKHRQLTGSSERAAALSAATWRSPNIATPPRPTARPSGGGGGGGLGAGSSPALRPAVSGSGGGVGVPPRCSLAIETAAASAAVTPTSAAAAAAAAAAVAKASSSSYADEHDKISPTSSAANGGKAAQDAVAALALEAHAAASEGPQALVEFVATHLSDLDEQGDAAWSYSYDPPAAAAAGTQLADGAGAASKLS